MSVNKKKMNDRENKKRKDREWEKAYGRKMTEDEQKREREKVWEQVYGVAMKEVTIEEMENAVHNDPGKLFVVRMYHDDWCEALKEGKGSGSCTCKAEMTVLTPKEPVEKWS